VAASRRCYSKHLIRFSLAFDFGMSGMVGHLCCNLRVAYPIDHALYFQVFSWPGQNTED
jgi:hypothetical protein